MEEIPISEPPQLRVGIAYNLKKADASDVADSEAEYDEYTTILAIQNALLENNCTVELFEATQEFPRILSRCKVDIVFNIAEGIKGRGREAQVPALLNFFRIPFTGSDEATLSIALDKALAKRILTTYHVKTPKYQVVRNGSRPSGKFAFPVIVKPNAEGSSKGISNYSIAKNREELDALIARNMQTYRQDMLVEEYIDGREFTVGLLGNGEDLRAFEPMEIVFAGKRNQYDIYSYEVKRDFANYIRYDCPASIDPNMRNKIVNTAKKIYRALECRDLARIDFRLSRNGELYFIEINPLPGLAPGYSDYPMLAEHSGTEYNALIRAILDAALKRYGLHFDL